MIVAEGNLVIVHGRAPSVGSSSQSDMISQEQGNT
jgi:hypothetical protein